MHSSTELVLRAERFPKRCIARKISRDQHVDMVAGLEPERTGDMPFVLELGKPANRENHGRFILLLQPLGLWEETERERQEYHVSDGVKLGFIGHDFDQNPTLTFHTHSNTTTSLTILAPTLPARLLQ